MLQGKTSIAGHKPYRDGYVTSRGTFQKYFEQQELQSLVASVTGEKPLAFAPGVVAVFKDKDLEQEVLLRRHSRAFVEGALPRPPRRERIVVVRPELRERIAPVSNPCGHTRSCSVDFPTGGGAPEALGVHLGAPRLLATRHGFAAGGSRARDETSPSPDASGARISWSILR